MRAVRRFFTVVLVVAVLLGLAYLITQVIEGKQGGSGISVFSYPHASSASAGKVPSTAASKQSGSSGASQSGALPAKGRVQLTYFSDAAFVGDSITLGWDDYKAAASLPDTNVIAAIGVTPPVNGVQWAAADGTYYDPVEKIAAAAPSKIYLMFGANKLVDQSTAAETTLLSNYGTFIDTLKQRLPNAVIYIQSVLLTTAAQAEKQPGLSADRITRINGQLITLAQEKGCSYLDLNESLSSGGVLQEGYAAADGLHLSKDGYIAWLEYLITHTVYDPSNPYVGGIDPGA